MVKWPHGREQPSEHTTTSATSFFGRCLPTVARTVECTRDPPQGLALASKVVGERRQPLTKGVTPICKRKSVLTLIPPMSLIKVAPPRTLPPMLLCILALSTSGSVVVALAVMPFSFHCPSTQQDAHWPIRRLWRMFWSAEPGRMQGHSLHHTAHSVLAPLRSKAK